MSRAAEEYELTINMMGQDYRELAAKAEGYRKALEQIREMHYYDSSATEMRQIAREALSVAAAAQPIIDQMSEQELGALEERVVRKVVDEFITSREPVPEAGESRYYREVPCPRCAGSRLEAFCHPQRGRAPCKQCGGLGWIKESINRNAAQEAIRQRDERIKELEDHANR